MIHYIIADNQELTRAGLKSVIKAKQPGEVTIADDKTELIIQLKEHPESIILLDYTLFDFNDANSLLITADRFARRSHHRLHRPDILQQSQHQHPLQGRSHQLPRERPALGKRRRAIHLATRCGNIAQPATEGGSGDQPYPDRGRDSEGDSARQDNEGNRQRAILLCPHHQYPSQEHLQKDRCQLRPRSHQVCLPFRVSGYQRVLYLESIEYLRIPYRELHIWNKAYLPFG